MLFLIIFSSLFKVDDLSRMFRLFSKIPRGLDPVSQIFKQVSSLPFFFFWVKGDLVCSISIFFHFCFYFYFFFHALNISWCSMMQHVTAEGTALVKQAEDAASNKKVYALTIFSFIFIHSWLLNTVCWSDFV